MKIEVTTKPDATPKEKGDLLETLARDLLRSQSFSVTNQVRVTGCELDLLCEHTVSGKTIYVECKAHRDGLSANVLTNLLGTVTLKDYEEGWLISTGPLGKDAKGILVEWEKKAPAQRSKLSIYTPERVIEALQNAGMITLPPNPEAQLILGEVTRIGDWTLLITPWGNYWTCPCLENGIPKGVIVFNSQTGKLVRSRETLATLASSDTTMAALDFNYALTEEGARSVAEKDSAVVEVEFGECWTDYRPSRPEHFVGRAKIQRNILHFLTAVKTGKTETRVFAIKGDSGIGKSSLIAKLRDRANRSKKPSSVFMFAVDVRAASTPGYVHASLLSTLRRAAGLGFGTGDSVSLRVTDVSDPLQSDSIGEFLQECERKRQLVVLVFDQFEELYSKPELFGVFEEARRLMFSTVSAATSFVLGFAWKTDSTVPQDHPAYYLWHQLSDHRFEAALTPFTHADAENSLRLFEKELGSRLRPELRKYTIEQSQGFPWLLKKLCIHLFEQLRGGASQSELENRSLDIRYLFDRDLSTLTPPEDACIKFIAKSAPVDWYEVIETFGADVVRVLQDKRLVIRRGDKLNLYWDIFREYVVNHTVPHIPFTHVPQSPSIAALLKVASKLDPIEPRSINDLGALCGYAANTVRNIIHDLSEFGIISDESNGILLDNHIDDSSPVGILGYIRIVLRRHALTAILRQQRATARVTQEDMMLFLKRINPAAKHHSRTWLTYAIRMGQWLTITGYLKQLGNEWIFEDLGEIQKEYSRRFADQTTRKRRVVFIGDAPPSRVIEALDYIKQHGPQPLMRMKSLGYRNACAVLYRFGLLEMTPEHNYRVPESHFATVPSLHAVWEKSNEEETLLHVINLFREKPSATAIAVGREVAQVYERKWTRATLQRIGNALRQWALWLLQGEQTKSIPEPPGRQQAKEKDGELSLFWNKRTGPNSQF